MKRQISVSAPNRKHPEHRFGVLRLSKNYRFSSSLSIETTLSIEC